MHKTDHNHLSKTDNLTPILILDHEATKVQPGQKTEHTGIAKELTTLPEIVKLVSID